MSRTGVGWVFAWMARRTAAAYGLINEALALVHEQRVGLSADTHDLLLLNTVAASKYLRILLVALRPSVKSADEGAVLVALADLGSRHKPKLASSGRSRVGYMSELLARAERETAGVRRFCACIGEANSVVVRALDEAGGHLRQARALLEGRSADVLSKN